MRTWAEVDRRLYQGQAGIATVSEARALVRQHGVQGAARQIDILIAATFAPVSWALLLFRSAVPLTSSAPERAWLGGIPLQRGFAPHELALDLGATGNRGPFRAGAHLLDSWLAGERPVLRLQSRAGSRGGEVSWEGAIGLNDLVEARLLLLVHSPPEGRLTVNGDSRPLGTYCGVLVPERGNAVHAWSGPAEPGVLDRLERILRPGFPILLAGGVGHVAWRRGAAIGLSAELRDLRRQYLRPLAIPGYGAGLA
ncbi:MAG: homocysteine biosynthesis protein, partial [Chloroflexia bacterium]